MKKPLKERIRGMMYRSYAEMLQDSAVRKPRELAVSRAYHSGRSRLGHYPVHLDVETTSICNLECPMCPYPEMRIPKGNMSMDLFRQIIDQCDGKVFDVLLHMYGEPLVNKSIFEMIAYAKQNGVRVTSMSTNLTLLTRERSAKLIGSGLDKLTLSFEGTDKETFEQVRKGASYEKCLENLRGFLEVRQQKRAQNPFAVLQIVQMKETEPGLKEFVDTFSKWTIDLLKVKSFVPCCRDYDNHEVLGDVNTQSLMDIWNSPRFMELRGEHLRGEYAKSALCAKCVEWSKYAMPKPGRLLRKISPVTRII
jgi:MoaA/NifB/PqqE/SkfB family radical SAM enzyme